MVAYGYDHLDSRECGFLFIRSSDRQSSACSWNFKDFSMTGYSEVPGFPKHLSPHENLHCHSEGTLRKGQQEKYMVQTFYNVLNGCCRGKAHDWGSIGNRKLSW